MAENGGWPEEMADVSRWVGRKHCRSLCNDKTHATANAGWLNGTSRAIRQSFPWLVSPVYKYNINSLLPRSYTEQSKYFSSSQSYTQISRYLYLVINKHKSRILKSLFSLKAKHPHPKLSSSLLKPGAYIDHNVTQPPINRLGSTLTLEKIMVKRNQHCFLVSRYSAHLAFDRQAASVPRGDI